MDLFNGVSPEIIIRSIRRASAQQIVLVLSEIESILYKYKILIMAKYLESRISLAASLPLFLSPILHSQDFLSSFSVKWTLDI